MFANRRSFLKDLLWVFALAGLAAAAVRLWRGLGATTGLNDASAWGVWIAFKLVFVALAGGGFILAALVYIFHLERYRPLLRRAILLAMLGYGSFIFSLLLDLGLPWHIYMPILHWQHHSIMFEIAWCVMLYFSVLLIEFTPVILEHPRWQHPFWQWIAHTLHRLTIPMVIAGIVLSTLHQSSLGGLFLMMPHRVHPLWYSPGIPVLFFTSAIAAGLAALIIESFLAVRLFDIRTDQKLLARIGSLSVAALWVYLGLRLLDLFGRGILPYALKADWQSVLFISEVLLGGVLPAGLFLSRRIQRSPAGLLSAALLVVLGIASQRMSLSMFTMWRPENAPYQPSGLEILIALGIPAAAGLLYFFFSEQLTVFSSGPAALRPTASKPLVAIPVQAVIKGGGFHDILLRRSLLGVGAIAAVLVIFPGHIQIVTPVSPARGWESLTINANQNSELVIFPHTAHQQRLASEREEACQVCHHLDLPGDQGSACSDCHQDAYLHTPIFGHTSHIAALGGNLACQNCHNAVHTRLLALDCQACHSEMTDLGLVAAQTPSAPGYFDAMHGTCLECHTQAVASGAAPALAECGACHAALHPDDEIAQAAP